MKFALNSLSGQIAATMTVALLIAGAINLALLLNERGRFGLIESSAPAITRFSDLTATIIERGADAGLRRFEPGARPGRVGRFIVSDRSLVEERSLRQNAKLRKRLADTLEALGHPGLETEAAARVIDRPRSPEWPPRFGPYDRPERLGRDGPRDRKARVREIVLSVKLPSGRWLNATMLAPLPNDGEAWRLAASTIVAFACVLAAALWMANRISLPLRKLAHAATRVGETQQPEEVPVQGPSDIRDAISAFNAMNHRVSRLLTEKDLMLGALGHDLRTPLTSLRIRIETMEPETERLKVIRTIEEANRQLDSILELARQGRNREPPRMLDLAVLVQDLVEDYSDTGAPVTFEGDGKAPVGCQPPQIQRALRNLIDNALAYAGSAHVILRKEPGAVSIIVEDQGPGLPPEDLETVKSPFARGESSRNRSTGGAGLGLALAEAIAKAHGGSLLLANRTPHGLAATLRLPVSSPA